MSTFRIDDLDAWYINLDHRTDRRLHIEYEAGKHSLTINRLPAFTHLDYHGPEENVVHMRPTQKTIGNWLSHTHLIRLAAASNRNVLVLEDDAILCSDFMARLQYLEDNLDLDWDIVFLGATFHVRPAVWHHKDLGCDAERTHLKHLFRAYGVWSNHGYIVRGENAGKVLGLMESVMPRANGSDHALILVQPQLNAYVFVPGAVFQMDGKSDIGEGFTKFSGFLRLGQYVFTDKMTDFDPDSRNWDTLRK